MDESVSLYIHIPFCKKKCAYCDFFSKPCADKKIPDSFISAVLRETKFYARKYLVSSWKTIYIGGGTPSLLSPKQLAALLSGVRSMAPFADDAEITVEMNPDDITDALLRAADENGVNRLSVGVQSLDDAVLKAVDRRCTRETTVSALNLISRKWRHRFSVDLISGLPSSTDSSFLETLSEVVRFNPDHISLYALTLEKGTPLGNEILAEKKPYDYDAADKQWMLGRDFLVSSGYNHYEVSNFSKPGFESAHNKTYWHLEDYIGVGAGASGTVYSDARGKNNGIRWTNTVNVPLYMQYWNDLSKTDLRNLPRDEEILSLETQRFEFLMMGFRLLEGVSLEEYKNRFGKDLGQVLGDSPSSGLFFDWSKMGRMRKYKGPNGFCYAFTESGLLFLNPFLESIL